MEEIEAPKKKRKLEDGGTPSTSTENHVTNGGSSVGTSNAAPSRVQSHLHFNSIRFEKIREITRVCHKNFMPKPKPNGSKLTLSTPDKKEVSPEQNSAKNAQSPDFVISSAGSSPAHSPQPMDFNVLSTPPRPSKPNEVSRTETDDSATIAADSSDRQKACSKLVERFEEASNKTLSNGVCSDSRTSDHEFSSVEVLDEGDQTRPVNSTAKTTHVNGEINASTASKNRNSPALSDVAPTANAEESNHSDFNINSDEFRQMLKKMIEERMTQFERSMGRDSSNDKVTDRLASLEEENKALREYAKKVEQSVKDMLNAEKEKASKRVTRAVQTQDPSWLHPLRPKTVASATPPSSVTATRASTAGNTVMTTPTPRLTSTVAPLPGHTVPSRPQSSPDNFRPAPQQQQQPMPLRPRYPESPNISPRPPAPAAPGVTYVPNYDPGPAARPTPSQPPRLRAAAPAQVFTSSPNPRFNGVRSAPPAVQPPRPMVRMQGPVASPAALRSVAPVPSSRPLPTVTVHPQTTSSSPSVQVPQEPPSYGYIAQNAYRNGDPGPRFAVAPQMRPQRPQLPQGGPLQVSPGPRPPVYPPSPMQTSPPQHMLQQPLRQEQQPAPRPHHPVPIRPSVSVQMQQSPMQQSPTHTINQHVRAPPPQQPGMVHYQQQVAGPLRQVATAQPSVPRPGFTQVPLRAPPPVTTGLPTGAVQPPPITSPTVQPKEQPPKPSVSIAVVTSGIVLSWNMPLEEKHAPIMNYQLYALQDGGTPENPHQWKKIGVVKALPLPMACTLTQFLPGNKYHFAVRATDELGRMGPFSDPCTITLK